MYTAYASYILESGLLCVYYKLRLKLMLTLMIPVTVLSPVGFLLKRKDSLA